MSDTPVKSNSSNYVRSFARGLRVIRAFGLSKPTMTVSEISNHAKIDRATARRILHTLVAEGYAVTDGKWFRLTPQILGLGFSYLNGLEEWDLVSGALQSLHEEVGETCSAGIASSDELVYIGRVVQEHTLLVNVRIGSRFPLHQSSMGRVFLAAWSDDEIDLYFQRTPLIKHTDKTITDTAQLKSKLADCRNNQFCVVLGEVTQSVNTIAVPVLDHTGRTVMSINVTSIGERVTEDFLVSSFLTPLQRAANIIGTKHGS